MKYKIEKNIPIPPKVEYGASKYPFAEMEVSDSVLISDCNANSIMSAASYYGRKAGGKKLLCRKEGEGMRVWRIK